MKPRICFFADGQSVHTQRWLQEMVARDFHVSLVTRRPWSAPGIEVITVSGRFGYMAWGLRLAEIRSIVRRLSPDLVHGHYLTSYGLWAAMSGVRPLVLTAWGSDILVTPKRSRIFFWLTKWLLRRADLATADSMDVVDEIKRYAPQANALQIQWGVDLQRIIPRTGVNRKDTIDIVSLRSWEPNYNISSIVRAFCELVNESRLEQCRLHLLGGGSLEAELRSMVQTLGIENKVIFHGMVDESRLVEILVSADISVSVPTSDATSMSVLESMAAALPVIVSKLPANRQWVSIDGGRIVPVGKIEELKRAMIELVQDEDMRRRMGKHNRLEIEKRASRKTEMDRVAELYHSLIKLRQERK